MRKVIFIHPEMLRLVYNLELSDTGLLYVTIGRQVIQIS